MAAINDLINQIEDVTLRERIQLEVNKLTKQKKFGLVFEEHVPECTPLYDIPVRKGSLVAKKGKNIQQSYIVQKIFDNNAECYNKETKVTETIPLKELVSIARFGDPIYPTLKPIDKVEHAPDDKLWHTLIESDNYHALQLLEYLYAGKVDCIYIDPPYNTGAKDWKYNNNYVDNSDAYRHSKWLSMMEKRLKLAKKLLNPEESVLIVTIDEKEYLHLGCLLEKLFPEANMQMVSSVINSKGVARGAEFFRVNEYLFFVRIGNSGVSALSLPDEWLGNIRTSTTKKVRWGSLMRSGSGSLRKDSPGCFYPIYISSNKKHFCGVGDILPLNVDRSSVVVPDGQIAIFPIHNDGTEGRWQYSRNKFIEIQKKGYVRISTQTKNEATIRYISEGWQKKVENGQIKVVGKAEDGSLIFDDEDYIKEFIPCNQWWIPSHNATEFGSKLIQSIIGKRFDFPKSLYAVHDAIKFFVKSKPNALIVDFFSGSGTTLHAINLLNAEDGGSRRCIMVTNNEVSEDEAKQLTQKGYHPGDAEWEKYGIARYVTWPRTVCSIEGHDVNNNLLKGNYIGSDIPMAKGFKSNCEYFKLEFLDKNEVALGHQFKEILPLLWLKSGAIGKCPDINDDNIPDMLILPKNNFAILADESKYVEFTNKLNESSEITTVFVVTDSERAYKEIISDIKVENTYQLYRDYLDNFRINSRRQ